MSIPAELLNPDRIRKVAFAITSSIEGGSYSAYQNVDSGIVSYGLFQFTLSSGSLQSVLENYIAAGSGANAQGLNAYMGRVKAKDQALRSDTEFERLLKAAGTEPAMKAAQEAVGTAKYWDRMMSISAVPRGLQLPLTLALFFDLAIHYGVYQNVAPRAEEALGLEHKTHLPSGGYTEKDLARKMVDIRRSDHYAQAERDNLPGLKRRADFWVALVEDNDWYLEGDAAGKLSVWGRTLQVWDPSKGSAGEQEPDPVDPVDETARIKRAAFGITGAFEGEASKLAPAWAEVSPYLASLRLELPYSTALLFDIAVTHEAADLKRIVEGVITALHGQPGRSVQENNIREDAFAGKLAGDYKTSLYRRADATGLRGWRNRADWWIALYASEDWDLNGDSKGQIVVFSSPVQVRDV